MMSKLTTKEIRDIYNSYKRIPGTYDLSAVTSAFTRIGNYSRDGNKNAQIALEKIGKIIDKYPQGKDSISLVYALADKKDQKELSDLLDSK